MLGHPVVLEHVQQGRLSGVVESEEEQFAGLLPEADVGQDVAEPIPEEHLELAILQRGLERKLEDQSWKQISLDVVQRTINFNLTF